MDGGEIQDYMDRKLYIIKSILENMQAKVIDGDKQIITSLNSFLPEGYDLTELERIFDTTINNEMDYGLLILRLLEYYIRACSENLVKFSDYTVLEEQTQKLEAEVRNHIKVEQSVKLYLEGKLRSLERYKKEAIERRYQVQELNERLLEMDTYCRKLVSRINGQPNNWKGNTRYNSMRSTTVPYYPAEQFKPLASAALKPSDLNGEEFEQSSYQPNHIARDLQAFRYYNQRVHDIKCDS